MKLLFPMTKPDGQEYPDQKTFEQQLKKESKQGQFGYNENNHCWHGGIHFTTSNARWLERDHAIRAIADGKVVACRIGSEYQTSEFRGKTLQYSTDFCLTEHEATYKEGNADKSFTFYTLYMHLASQSDKYASCPIGRRFRLSETKSARKTADDPESVQVEKDTIIEEIAEAAQIYNKKEYRAFKIIDTKQEKPELEGQIYWFENRKITKDPFADFTSEISQPAYKPKQYKMIMGDRNVRAHAGTSGKKQLLNRDTIIAETGLPAQVKGINEFRAFKVLSRNNSGLAAQGKIIWMMVKEAEVKDELAKYITEVNSPQWMMKKEVTGKVVADTGTAGFPEPETNGYQASDSVAVIKQGTKVKYNRDAAEHHMINGENYLMARCSFPDNDVKEMINGSALSGAWMIVSPDVVVTTEREHIDFDSVQSLGSDSPYIVKAGDPIGYLGLYEIPDEDNTQDLKKVIRMIHFEQLSKDEPPEGFFKLLMKEEAVKKLIRIEDKDSDGYLDENEPPTIFDELSQLLSDEPDKPVVRVEDKIKNLSGWDKCKPVIACHESEWYEEEKSYLDKILELFSHPDTEELIGHEKERIKNLVWMKQETQVQFEKHVWHWWPVIMSGYFITKSQVDQLFPDAPPAKREEIRAIFNQYNQLFEINTPERAAQFFAQIRAEVGSDLTGKEESLWYSVNALKSFFPRYFHGEYKSEADDLGYIRIKATDYSRLSNLEKAEYTVVQGKRYYYKQKPQEDEIAKRVYSCNGETGFFNFVEGGDPSGIKFKGRGFIQLTWKKNYSDVQNVLAEKIPDLDFNILEEPEVLVNTKEGFLSAFGFWELNSINDLVDETTISTLKITNKVNSGLNREHKIRRNDYFVHAYEVLNHE